MVSFFRRVSALVLCLFVLCGAVSSPAEEEASVPSGGEPAAEDAAFSASRRKRYSFLTWALLCLMGIPAVETEAGAPALVFQ